MAACIKAINTIFEPQPRSKELFQKEETEPYQKLYLEKMKQLSARDNICTQSKQLSLLMNPGDTKLCP